MLLTQARLFDEPQLATLCLDCIDENTREALSADGKSLIFVTTACRTLCPLGLNLSVEVQRYACVCLISS